MCLGIGNFSSFLCGRCLSRPQGQWTLTVEIVIVPIISDWDYQYNFLRNRQLSRLAKLLGCRDCYLSHYISFVVKYYAIFSNYVKIITSTIIYIYMVGWNRQLSTSPSRNDFHFPTSPKFINVSISGHLPVIFPRPAGKTQTSTIPSIVNKTY